jgi:hypothetical protein
VTRREEVTLLVCDSLYLSGLVLLAAAVKR